MSYCPSCQSEFDSSIGAACPKCGYGVSSAPVEQALVVRAERVIRPGCVKVGATFDGTGSTRTYQASIPIIFGDVLACLGGLVTKLDIDVWKHGDEDFNEVPVQLVQSGTAQQALDALRSIQYSGGFDAAETHATQIERLSNVTAWGTRLVGCRNVLLAFLTDDTKPLPSGKPMRQLGTEIKAKRVKLFLVCQSTPSLQELVDAAGGFLIEISNNPDTAEIKKVVSSLCATLTATMSGAGGTVPMSAVVV